MNVVLQKSLNDCGLACVAMLAMHHGKPVDYEALLAMAPDGMWGQGLSMKKLRDIALELGLQTQAYRCPSHKFSSLDHPCIAHCRGDHYVVVERCDTRGVEIVDPRYGRIDLSLTEFAKTYSGICMLAGPVEQPLRCNEEDIDAVTTDAWQQGMRSAFLQWARSISVVAVLHVGIVVAALLALEVLLRQHMTALFLAVTLVWCLESLVLPRGIEPALLRAYLSMIRKIAELCSPAQGHLVEIPGGYRLSERMRWMAEQLYNSRDNFLSLGNFATGLFVLLSYSIISRDALLALGTLIFGAAAFSTAVPSMRRLPLTREEHSVRRFVESLLDQFVSGVPGALPVLKSKALSEIFQQNAAALVGGLVFVAYWLVHGTGENAAAFLCLGGFQLKLLDWWKASRPAAISCRIIHHCYEHLECMHIAAQALSRK